MQTLIKEDEHTVSHGQAVATEPSPLQAYEQAGAMCRALWLSPLEANALLALCVASPASGGACEQELFGKLGAYMRSFA
jgi:hypothetical protein